MSRHVPGDDAKAKRQLVPNRKTSGETISVEAWLRARLGDTTRGEQLLRQNWTVDNPSRQAVEGDLALARDTANGIRLLEAAIPKLSPAGTYYREVEVLASAWMRNGETDRAMDLLKRASARRGFAYSNLVPFSPFWVRDELLPAEAFAQAKRYPEARTAAGELRRLLAFADPEFPLLVRLRQLEQRLQ